MRRINVRQELVEQNRLRTALENRFEQKLVRVFKGIGDRCVAAIGNSQALDAIYRDIPAKLSPEFQKQYADVINLFAGRMTSQLKPEKAEQRFEYLAREWYRFEGAQRVQEVSNTTKSIIEKALSDGFAEELTQTQIAKNIKERTGGAIGKRRAQTIARTETHAAANFASNRIAEEVGANSMLKRWVSADDDRTRPHHREMNGKEVGINDLFIVPYKGIPYKMAYPGDPRGGAGNVINCRCVVAYHLPEDEIKDPKVEQEQTWGDATQEEIVFHKESWGTEPAIREAISATKAVPKIEYGVSRAYCSLSEIAMSPKKDAKLTDADRTVWRHEYGHWIDKNNRVAGQDPNSGYLSGEAWEEIKRDRKNIADLQGDAYKKYRDDYSQLNNKPMSLSDFQRELKSEWLTADELFKIIDEQGIDLIRTDQARAKMILAAIRNEYIGGETNFNAGIAKLFHHLSRSTQEGLMFADFIEAVTNAASGFGHGASYYQKFPNVGGLRSGVRSGHTTEAYANYTSLIGGKNGKIWRKILENFAPLTVKKFDKLTEEVGKKAKHDRPTHYSNVRQRSHESGVREILRTLPHGFGDWPLWGQNRRESRRNL